MAPLGHAGAIRIRATPPAIREFSFGRFIIERGQSQLMQIISALRPSRGLTGRLNGRQQQSHQHADDGDYDQQLNECESPSLDDAVWRML